MIPKHYLIHDSYHAKVVSADTDHAKLARLSYKVIEEIDGNSLLEIDLETGRYHQIRVQLAFIGCPILGDRKYGSQRAYQKGAIALRHQKIEFPHPVTKEMLRLGENIPD